jgi:hypothetical protein
VSGGQVGPPLGRGEGDCAPQMPSSTKEAFSEVGLWYLFLQ